MIRDEKRHAALLAGVRRFMDEVAIPNEERVERENAIPDEIVDRFCIVGPVETHIQRMQDLKDLGVDQFAVYLQHDDKDHTLQAYGEKVLPAVADHVRAKN